jgi:hypothetical protein
MSCCAAGLLLTKTSAATELVSLKSGGTLIGNVSYDGDAIVVQMRDSKVRVPTADVVTVASLDLGPTSKANDLLLGALEARLLSGSGTEAVSRIAEAARMAPDDSRIAYWHASMLAEAGYGKAASEVFEAHREGIAKAYPGMADRLASRIRDRVEIEKLPEELVERIDNFNASSASNVVQDDMQPVAGVFRLVDQSDSPLDRSMFQVQCNGSNEQRIEAFEDGYYFFTAKQNRRANEVCKVVVNQVGLRPSEFELAVSADRVPVSKGFVVQRYDDSAKQTYRALVVDKAGKPVAGAKLTLQAVSDRPTRYPGEQPSAVADAQGKIEIQAFPMRYNVMVSADGYKPEGQMIELKEGVAQEDQRFELYRMINASIHVAWTYTGGLPTPTVTAGEAVLEIKGGQLVAAPYDQNGPVWVRPMQVKDRLVLQFNPFQYGVPGPGMAFSLWSAEAGDGSDGGKAKEKFESLELCKFDDWKKDLKPVDFGRNSPAHRTQVQIPAEEGKVYVGKVPHRDMRTGQPVEAMFKLYVEVASDAAK